MMRNLLTFSLSLLIGSILSQAGWGLTPQVAKSQAQHPQAMPGNAASKPQTLIRDSERRIQLQPKSWLELKRENLVMQQQDYSCGAAALATVIRYHWGDDMTERKVLEETVRMLTPEELKERIENGLALTDLKKLANRLGYLSTIGKLKLEDLKKSKIPLIVGIVIEGYDHFVVVRGMDDQYVYMADSARGQVRTPIEVFQKQWQKNAVLVVVKKGVDNPEDSILKQIDEEKSLGELNRQFVRDQATGALPFPFR